MKQEFSFIRLVQFDESFLCLVGQVLCQVIRFCIAADVRKQTLDEHSPLHTGIVIKVKLDQPSVFAALYYPDIIGPEYAYKTANWLFGCHPYHNYSFVATVGATHPKAMFYGNNRADFSFIPGNVAPGVLFRNPDHFENFDDWPFIWGQNEGTTNANTNYLIFGYAFRQLVEQEDNNK